MYLKCHLIINCLLFFETWSHVDQVSLDLPILGQVSLDIMILLAQPSKGWESPQATASVSSSRLPATGITSPSLMILPSCPMLNSSWSFLPFWDSASLKMTSSSFPEFPAIYSTRLIERWTAAMRVALFTSNKQGHCPDKHQYLWKHWSKQAHTHLQAPQA
jgi:hypothetical protein